MPVHIGSKIPTDAREHDVDLLPSEIIQQIVDGLRGGVIDIRDRAGVDNEAADWRRGAFHESTHFVDEAVGIGIE